MSSSPFGWNPVRRRSLSASGSVISQCTVCFWSTSDLLFHTLPHLPLQTGMSGFPDAAGTPHTPHAPPIDHRWHIGPVGEAVVQQQVYQVPTAVFDGGDYSAPPEVFQSAKTNSGGADCVCLGAAGWICV